MKANSLAIASSTFLERPRQRDPVPSAVSAILASFAVTTAAPLDPIAAPPAVVAKDEPENGQAARVTDEDGPDDDDEDAIVQQLTQRSKAASTPGPRPSPRVASAPHNYTADGSLLDSIAPPSDRGQRKRRRQDEGGGSRGRVAKANRTAAGRSQTFS